MILAEQQLNHFNTFGFLVFRQFFSLEEVRIISREVDTGLDAFLPDDAEHDRNNRHGDSLMDANTPFITSLIDDPRLADAAEQLLDTQVIPGATDANYFVGDTGWHVDNPNFDYAGVRFISYLEPLEATTGALRVIPGSHREPFHSQISRDTQPVYGMGPDEIPAFVFNAKPGDVLAFNYWIWHAAFGGGDHRRMFGAVYVYRTDFFDEAGLPHPARHGGWESYDQLHDVAQKLTQRDASGNVSRWGWYRALDFQVLSKVLDEGEHWWDETNQEFTLTSDAMIKWINKLYFEPLELGISPNEEQTPEMSNVEMLTEGVVAMSDRFFTLHIAEDAGRSEVEVMTHMQSPPTFEGQPDADRHYTGGGGWACGIPSAIASDRLQGAFDLATAQYNPDVARAFHRFVGPPGALKSYANDPYLDELYEETVYGAVTVDMYRWQVTHPGVFFGWEWGNITMPGWPSGRCSGGAYVGDSEEAAAARCDRGSWVSGKYTAEELAEEWQEWATRVRKEWYESI